MTPNGNRLIHEKSPYLLQHAHNPIDWYPWGKEALEKARAEDRPIFLSIGYATCHWCHVMEKESFSNPEIGKLMNETFVCIKVDREEHPEIDSIYMEFAQALMSSAGGWPLNVILTPDLKPFFAVTYLPPKTAKGLIGLDQFIAQIHMLWKSDEKEHLVRQADKIVELFQRSSRVIGEDLPGQILLENALQMFFSIADPIYGGIKGAPKFPLGYQANFLLQYSREKKENRALFYVELTLEAMSRGGIYDHLGGGFARYSIDEKWQVPHFEKMLYDNAILTETFTQAWQFTKKTHYAEVAKETIEFLLKEMAGKEGGWISAQDADFEGHEGRYYTWTLDEIISVIPEHRDAEMFCRYFGISADGNFEGTNILHIEKPLSEFASSLNLPIHELSERLTAMKKSLYQKRSERKPPFKDDKIVASWNGLMIHSLAKASQAFQEPRYREAALKGARFMQEKMWKDSTLFRRFREGESRFPGGLDDYAFLIRALITLFEIEKEAAFLKWAVELTDLVEKKFKAKEGAFFQTEEDPLLVIRKCEFYDGAEPSGNAIHCENLLRLHQMTHKQHYLEQAEDILKASKSFVEAFPPGACYHLMNLHRYLDLKSPLVVICLNEQGDLKNEIENAIGQNYIPCLSVVWKTEENRQALKELLPNLEKQDMMDRQTTLYVCRQTMCEEPKKGREEILKTLENL